jgi:hypothetical protein
MVGVKFPYLSFMEKKHVYSYYDVEAMISAANISVSKFMEIDSHLSQGFIAEYLLAVKSLAHVSKSFENFPEDEAINIKNISIIDLIWAFTNAFRVIDIDYDVTNETSKLMYLWELCGFLFCINIKKDPYLERIDEMLKQSKGYGLN